VNGPEHSRQVQMETLRDPLSDDEFEEFLFRAHKTKNTVKLESIKYPSYFLAKSAERIDNRHPVFELELLQPQKAEKPERATFSIQGRYNSNPNSFSFVQVASGGRSFFITNNGYALRVLEAGMSFAHYPEKREEVSFYLQKKE